MTALELYRQQLVDAGEDVSGIREDSGTGGCACTVDHAGNRSGCVVAWRFRQFWHSDGLVAHESFTTYCNGQETYSNNL